MGDWAVQAYDFFKHLVNPETFIKVGGLTLLTLVVFAETGLLVGFFLPGDSLLFTAGLLSANPKLGLPIWRVLVFVTAAAIAGDSFGYYLGKRYGPKVFKRHDSRIFKPEYVIMTKRFYAKHGAKTLILGRFLPIIRTFAPVLAGVISMEYRKFLIYNVVGGFLWVWSLTLMGFFLGTQFPWIKNYYEHIVIAFIVVTAIPVIRTWIAAKKDKARGRDPLADAGDLEAQLEAKIREEGDVYVYVDHERR
ncbi:MAG: VTT domain-containing protein [Bacteroidia bacterium]|nr:VTT domain-containing protein [Bacteroidia bacterium]MDW8332853.1 VTT domain-containing protein [Bacteroidia bacterium]